MKSFLTITGNITILFLTLLMTGCGETLTPEERVQVEKGWDIIEQGEFGDIIVFGRHQNLHEIPEYLFLIRPNIRRQPVIMGICFSPYTHECLINPKDARFASNILKIGTPPWENVVEIYQKKQK